MQRKMAAPATNCFRSRDWPSGQRRLRRVWLGRSLWSLTEAFVPCCDVKGLPIPTMLASRYNGEPWRNR